MLYVCTVVVDIDKLSSEIAQRFKEYGMDAELGQLRAFYAERRRRLRAQARCKQPPWDEGFVVQWAALWRIPPFDTVYLQLEKGLPCPCGKATSANTFTESVFPEGRVWRCLACGGVWLVLDG